jgi:transcriptional regulator with XRE-family HTH domain
MKQKNEIFASALDWLVSHQIVDGQKRLASATGISENTISRIMTGKVEPSDDTLRKLSEKFGFSMSWLRGSDPVNMFEKDKQQNKDNIQQSSVSLYEKLITTLEKQLTDKDGQIDDLRQQVADLRQQVADLRQQLALITKKEPSELPVEYSVKM